jgi:hypothetical protein
MLIFQHRCTSFSSTGRVLGKGLEGWPTNSMRINLRDIVQNKILILHDRLLDSFIDDAKISETVRFVVEQSSDAATTYTRRSGAASANNDRENEAVTHDREIICLYKTPPNGVPLCTVYIFSGAAEVSTSRDVCRV